MKKKKIVILTLGIIITIIFLFVIIGYLSLSGYIFMENQSPMETKEMIEQIKNKKEISLKEIVSEEWDVAFVVTNENEMEIIERLKKEKILKDEVDYPGLDTFLQQLNNIIFTKEGLIVKEIVYDSRYYSIKTKDKIIYSDNCNFKVKKIMSKIILEQN